MIPVIAIDLFAALERVFPLEKANKEILETTAKWKLHGIALATLGSMESLTANARDWKAQTSLDQAVANVSAQTKLRG